MDLTEQLNHIFYPKGVAVVGASLNPEKVGYMFMANILDGGFSGKVYPVNPALTEAFGLRAFPSLRAIPGEVDLAIIVVPAEAAIAAVADCAAKGVKGAILVTSGFKELGTAAGLELQQRLSDIAHRNGLQLIGPNTLGLVNPGNNLNATFQSALGSVKCGNVAVAAQSGGMCHFIIQALSNHNVGISKAIGLGNRGGLDFDGVLAYFAEDEETTAITLYIEGLEQPRRLMDVARKVVKRKPVLVLKSGRTEQSSRATLSHTGALAGRDEFYRAAFRQCGIMAVDTTTELVDKVKALAMQAPAAGDRVAIISGMGGPGIVITDRCSQLGLKLAQFSPATWQRLRKVVSPLNSVDNPVDISWGLGDYEASCEIIRATMEDGGVDGVTASLDSSTISLPFTRAVTEIAPGYHKPMTVSLGPEGSSAIVQQHLFEEKSIPTYPVPERAVTGLASLVQYGAIRRRFC